MHYQLDGLRTLSWAFNELKKEIENAESGTQEFKELKWFKKKTVYKT